MFLTTFFGLSLTTLVTSEITILTSSEKWTDDFAVDKIEGKHGWSLSENHYGLNTTNHYHGFYNNIINREFIYPNIGQCNISFNIVFNDCNPPTNDYILFEINTNSKKYINVFQYTNDSHYQYLNDLRIYLGNNDTFINKNCINNNTEYGGYTLYHKQMINIINKKDSFNVIFKPYFNNNPNNYYGFYNFEIMCNDDVFINKNYGVVYSAFMSINLVFRELILWITAGVIFLFIFGLIIHYIIHNNDDKNIKNDENGLNKKNKKERNPNSIFYSAALGINVKRQQMVDNIQDKINRIELESVKKYNIVPDHESNTNTPIIDNDENNKELNIIPIEPKIIDKKPSIVNSKIKSGVLSQQLSVIIKADTELTEDIINSDEDVNNIESAL